MTLTGIDVSKWQGLGIDWRKFTAAGWDFAFAKATEGTGYTDPTYAHNEAEMDAVPGLIRGAYAWLTPGADQAKAAALFVRVASPLNGRLCAIDVEQAGVTERDLRDWDRAFKSLTGGHPLIVYVGRNVLSTMKRHNPRLDLSDIGPWWEPYYPPGSGYPGDSSVIWRQGMAGWKAPTIWQYGPARIPSYTKAVDGDACLLSAPELAALGGTMNPLYVTSGDPKSVALTVGDQLWNPDGTPLVKMSGPASRTSPMEVALGSTRYRLITVTTGGHAVAALVRVADVTVSDIATTPSTLTQADVDAAKEAGYASAKANAVKAVGAI